MLHRFTVRLNSVFASGLTLASLSGLDRFLHKNKQALIENIDYDPKREINKAQILSLASMDFIRSRQNIIINGIAGVGKSTMAQAFGIRAIQSGFTVYYTRTATLLEDIKFARIDGSYTNCATC